MRIFVKGHLTTDKSINVLNQGKGIEFKQNFDPYLGEIIDLVIYGDTHAESVEIYCGEVCVMKSI